MGSSLEVLDVLTLDASVVWGLIPRVVGAVFIIAFASIFTSIQGFVGKRGITPVADQLAAARAAYGPIRAIIYKPTLLWLSQSAAMLRLIGVLGLIGGAVAIYGGEFGWVGLLVAWLCFLSLDVMNLVFPWHLFLYEAGFISLFLPAGQELPSIAAAAAPAPMVALALQWAVARLMWGFAKTKFRGTRKGDALYMRGFLATANIPTPVGWLIQHAPNFVLVAMLGFMSFAEIIAPGLALFGGPLRPIGAITLMTLMVGIQATGNWGFFNTAYAILCISFLDPSASIWAIAESGSVADLLSHPLNIVGLAHILYSLPCVPYNNWNTQNWPWWPSAEARARKYWWLRPFFGLYRLLCSLRIANGYGVFRPNSWPPVRFVPVFEATLDGENWEPYEYRWQISQAWSKPTFHAPLHPHFDQLIKYFAMDGVAGNDLESNLYGHGHPFSIDNFGRYSYIDRIVQRLAENEPSVVRLFGKVPFAGQKPKAVRVASMALTPTTIEEWRQTGNWWKTKRCGVLLDPTGVNPAVWEFSHPPAELLHPDDVVRKGLSKPLSGAMQRYRRSGNMHESVVGGSVSEQDVERFWSEFVPFISEELGEWKTLESRAQQMYERFTMEGVEVQSKILERYCWILRTRVIEAGRADELSSIKLSNHFMFHMTLHHHVLGGKECLEAALGGESPLAESKLFRNYGKLLYPFGLLRYEQASYHQRYTKMTNRLQVRRDGIYAFLAHMQRLPTPPEVEWVPAWRRSPEGEWTVEDFVT